VLVALVERQGASLAEILAGFAHGPAHGVPCVGALSRPKTGSAGQRPRRSSASPHGADPSGEQFGARCLVVAEEVRKAAVAHFSSEEIATLHGWLRRMVDNLDELDRQCAACTGAVTMDCERERAIDSGRRCT